MQKFLLMALALSVASCGDRPAPEARAPESSEPDIAKTQFAPSLGVDFAAMTRTPGGAYIRDLTVGTGEPAAAGQQVAIHYAGTLPDGTRFDANGPSDPPYVFRLSNREVVPGFDEGVTGMRAGGRRQVIIPPSLGYGSQPNGPIPANSILVFTIDLVSIR